MGELESAWRTAIERSILGWLARAWPPASPIAVPVSIPSSNRLSSSGSAPSSLSSADVLISSVTSFDPSGPFLHLLTPCRSIFVTENHHLIAQILVYLMLSRWSRAAFIVRHFDPRQRVVSLEEHSPLGRSYSGVPAAAAAAPTSSPGSDLKQSSSKQEVKLNSLFWSKPSSLALPPGSPLRIEEPQYEGLRHIMLKLLLFYSKQSRSIRGANAVYRRIISQVDKPAIYDVFNLENTFRTTFSLLVLHMWLFLRRLKEEGKEGAEFGQYLYEIYNHDLEMRVSKAGVNLLLTKWMKELEKIFYGNIVAYDDAMKPDAKHDELANAIWRNIFSDDGTGPSNDAATTAAMSRYTRRESTCLSLTDKEAIFSGNFLFTSLELQSKYQKLHN
ncbi:hypothetical protein IEQ34_020392 [Dendrobium chrysotoxum]|uniref:Ubiquinol-cytochrome c chaperone domain-containing protein n=1 Tax=Dendrobium chrysotoxum TaxID=161865 RepID=A0AAV7FKI1_DENCH|nr:hypothetical protein IEQ34_020392 [Dendrobium chrysotoxum]